MAPPDDPSRETLATVRWSWLPISMTEPTCSPLIDAT